ncbi:ArsA-related P-loop ATPase [Psychrobacter sp. UBA3480]|uniref:nucleotide-binding protein n=1 Tax=Psychrobacter sp. UBA3480 TaxID=1947350 RepID=UPI0025D7C6F9|nr:ArsA-related P-loop ATPase [Psychrobacter sp. UBA3480]
MNTNNIAHFVLQSKGGAGKSVCSSILAQYLSEQNKETLLIDTDPSNKTLGSFKGLDVEEIQVLSKSKIVDQSAFDGFVNKFMSVDSAMLVDTGSGDFLPINSYILQNELPEIFQENGKQMVIHCPINFGQSEEETIKCLIGIVANYPNTPIVVWENEFFGINTNEFRETVLFKQTNNIIGSIKIRKMLTDTEECDFSYMLKQSLTFNQVSKATDSNYWGFIQKTRINRIKKEIWEQLDDLFDTFHSLSIANETSDAEQVDPKKVSKKA